MDSYGDSELSCLPSSVSGQRECASPPCSISICAFTIPRRDLERLAHAYSVPLLRPISAVPDDYRFGVRSNFAEGWQEVEITDFLGGGTS